MKNSKIFIQIACYRDPELIPTIEDCLSNAKKPGNLVFCIHNQYSPEDNFNDLSKYREDYRFKIIDTLYTDGKGTCWARNKIQQYYDNEEYTLQLDSHHRFTKNWDTELIKELKKLQKRGYKKPMLTGYIPHYDPTNDPDGRVKDPWYMHFDRISPDGNVHFLPASVDDFKERTEPLPARFYSAHFCFTLGSFAKKVQHDPEYYFHGEEISVGVRAFTHGYDLFSPHKIFIWHFYTRNGLKRHWDDHTDWVKMNDHAHSKNRRLFGMDGEKYTEEEFGIYGFGKERTLEDYERYAGISFKKRGVQQYTLDKKYPPNPIIEDETEYNNSFSNFFKHCIDIQFSDVPHDDYDTWAVAFEDENGKELYRLDATPDEIKEMKSDKDGYCKVWRSFNTVSRPYKWIVWPHSVEHGWVNRMEGILYEKPKKLDRILVHLPAYREPELIPTIEDALKNATHPERIIFGICRQYNPEDGFDNIDKYRDNPQFKIKDILYTEAKGLAYARGVINNELLDDEEFVLQLDSHHRFTENWDTTLLGWYYDLKEEGHNPLICGYLPYYNPFNDPADRVQEPWLTEAASFYPHGTIFIRPTGVPNWKELTKPYPARFVSGHFCFGPNKWAKDVKHDPNIFFAGEELNLTIRSFTHGYDLFHPHRLIIWHATMREERGGMLVWDDQHKRGESMWWKQQDIGRSRIRQLIGVEDGGHDLTGYELGTVRTVRDYEKYAGIHFKKKSFQKYTKENKFPPNPVIEDEQEWEDSFMYSFYHLVTITRVMLPKDNYTHILVAYDDENGVGINSMFIEDQRLTDFLEKGTPIHYEEMFMTDVNPSRVVYWGLSKDGWEERVEINL